MKISPLFYALFLTFSLYGSGSDMEDEPLSSTTRAHTSFRKRDRSLVASQEAVHDAGNALIEATLTLEEQKSSKPSVEGVDRDAEIEALKTEREAVKGVGFKQRVTPRMVSVMTQVGLSNASKMKSAEYVYQWGNPSQKSLAAESVTPFLAHLEPESRKKVAFCLYENTRRKDFLSIAYMTLSQLKEEGLMEEDVPTIGDFLEKFGRLK